MTSESDSYEFAAPSSSWLTRAYHTPVSDVIRGRLSGRLDVRAEIAGAGLPAPISGLIWHVARKSRLWRNEKLDVARELVAHFADGLAAGRSADELVAHFGDVKTATRLIRKAKIRTRPLWWQSWRVAIRTFLLLLVVSILGYAALTARFYWGKPQLARNFWHEVNASRRVPEAKRAWPLYRAAGLKLNATAEVLDYEWLRARPGSEEWDRLVADVQRHRELIELARAAAKKPHLGYFAGDPVDRIAAREAGKRSDLLSKDGPLADDNDFFYNMRLDHANVFRPLAWLLCADALRAAESGDSGVIMENLTAAISMAEQIYQPRSTLVEQLVSFAIFNLAMETSGRILTEHPQALSETQLRDLAHRMAAYRGGTPTLDLSAERMGFEDCLQRVYTDDGSGDGRITPKGLQLLDEWQGDSTRHALTKTAREDLAVALGVYLANPGVAALVGGRRENWDLYESLASQSARAHQGPPWQWDYDSFRAATDRLRELTTGMGRVRYMPVLLLTPSFDAAYNAVERVIQYRDATEVVIALQLWHRRHGQWPASLEELTPDLLPAVPPDRIDGRPLRYALRDGKPVLYSLGIDYDDDGGRAIAGQASGPPPGNYGPAPPEQLELPQSPMDDGDWILWPPSE